MRKILWTILFSSVFINTVNATNLTDVLKPTELSVASGVNWVKTNNAHLVVSAFETDLIRVKDVGNKPVWKLGLGYSILEDRLKSQSYLNHLLVELNLYHTSTILVGDVWQFQQEQFNNFGFRAPIESTRAMIDIKPTLFTCHEISPYLILGAGWNWSTMSYGELANNSLAPTPNNLARKETQNFAYEIGLGARTTVIGPVSATLEYMYTHLGSMSSGMSSTVLAAPKFGINTHGVLLGLSYDI